MLLLDSLALPFSLFPVFVLAKLTGSWCVAFYLKVKHESGIDLSTVTLNNKMNKLISHVKLCQTIPFEQYLVRFRHNNWFRSGMDLVLG